MSRPQPFVHRLADYKEYLKRKHLADSTKDSYIYELNRFSNYYNYDHFELSLIDNAFRDMEKDGIATTPRLVYAVRDLLLYWDEDRIAKKLIPPNEPKKPHKRRIARKPVVDDYIHNGENKQDGALFTLAYQYAMRISELQALYHKDVNIYEGYIDIHTSKKKRNRGRIDRLPLFEDGFEYIREYIKAREQYGLSDKPLLLKKRYYKDEWILQHMSKQQIRYRFMRAGKWSDHGYYNPHSFRHGRITDLKADGIPGEIRLMISRQSATWSESREAEGRTAMLDYEHLELNDKIRIFEKHGIACIKDVE